jgi:hypothetical protein
MGQLAAKTPAATAATAPTTDAGFGRDRSTATATTNPVATERT